PKCRITEKGKTQPQCSRLRGDTLFGPNPKYHEGLLLPRLAVILAATTMAVPAIASEPVLLHAAGSLRTALTEVTGAFVAASGQRVQAKYGPFGMLKDEIADGAHAEGFAS